MPYLANTALVRASCTTRCLRVRADADADAGVVAAVALGVGVGAGDDRPPPPPPSSLSTECQRPGVDGNLKGLPADAAPPPAAAAEGECTKSVAESRGTIPDPGGDRNDPDCDAEPAPDLTYHCHAACATSAVLRLGVDIVPATADSWCNSKTVCVDGL